MTLQLIVVGVCILLAVIFMGKKIFRTLGGRPQCECGKCDKECQSCQEGLRNLNDRLNSKKNSGA